MRATDAAGNQDASVAVRNWRVTPPPTATILTGPTDPTESTSATFTFEANQTGATFECALDQDISFTPCESGVSYTGLAIGEHEFSVRARGTDNNVGTPASYGWQIGDTTPPVVRILTGPPAATEATTATFTFETNDPATTYQCSLDGRPFVVCESGRTYTEAEIRAANDGSLAGPHTLEVQGLVPNLLVDPLSDIWEWTIDDLTAPETTILAGTPTEVTLDTPITLHFSSNEPDAEFECALDGEPFASCASPPENSVEYNLEAGTHTVLVRAVDPSLNADATPESFTWNVVGAPTTTILTGPPAAPAITPDTDMPVTFTFAANQAGVSYACSLDGAEFTACTSPITYTEAQLRGTELSAIGEHTFEVQATNSRLFVEDPPASRTFIIDDRLDPQTTIDSGPTPTTASTNATLTFSSNELDATFECSLNGEPFAGCDSPLLLTDLALGTYTLEVVAIDAAGHRDPTPASWTWTVEAPPQPNTPAGTDVIVTLTSPVQATVTFAQVTAPGFTTVSALGAAPALPEGYVTDGAVYYDVSTTAEYGAPVTVCVPYNEAAYTPLPVRVLHHDGTEWTDVTVSTMAGMACGVTDTLSPFAVAAGTALVVPETTLESGPESPSPLSTATFEFSSNDATASFECALDDPLAWTSCDTPYLVEGLLPGQHEMLIRAENALGNADATPIVHRWTVTPPDTTIVTGPPAETVNTTASFTFSSNDPLAGFQCSLDGESFSSCDTPHLEENLLPGNRELLVRAVNDAGTVDPTPASHRWTVRPLPDTAIIERPADPTDSRSARFSFVSNLPGVTFECALDDAVDSLSFTPCTSPVTYDNLIFGEHDFAVRAVDADGNVDPTPAEWGWDVEGLAPPVDITSAPDPVTESRTASVRASPPTAATSSTSARSTAASSRSASRRRSTTACRSARTSSASACSCPTRRPSRRRRSTSGRSSRRRRPRPRSSSARPTRATTSIPRAAARSPGSRSRATRRP